MLAHAFTSRMPFLLPNHNTEVWYNQNKRDNTTSVNLCTAAIFIIYKHIFTHK